MKFDAFNAMIFHELAKRKGIEDRNKIVLVAGMASGSPLMKVLIPMQLINQAEEITERDEANRKLTQDRAGYQHYFRKIETTLSSDKSSEEKLAAIQELFKSNGADNRAVLTQ